MNCLVFFLIFFGVLTPHAKTKSPDRLHARGLFIEFDPNADLSLRNQIHRYLDSKVVYRSKSQAIDVVQPNDKTILNFTQRKGLQNLCEKYRTQKYVFSCELYLDFPPPDTCSLGIKPPVDTLKDLNKQVAELCSPLEMGDLRPMEEGLSPLWAQHLIGTDLAKEHMEKMNQVSPLMEAELGNLDGGFDISKITGKYSDLAKKANGGNFQDHGTKVVNLMNGDGPYSVAYKARLTVLADGYSKPYPQAVDEILVAPPTILNYEIHTLCMLKSDCGGAPKVYSDSIKKLSEKSIVVAAAGNYYPRGSLVKDDSLNNIILVGSATPDGMISGFSDEAEGVTILAPSDNSLQVPGVEGTAFGGTSGATPLVSGALANVISILGPELSVEEAKKLLSETSIKLAVTTQQKTKLNGVGMLNVYKLVRVAEKLKKDGWPKVKSGILNPFTYDFTSEAARILKQAEKKAEMSDCKSRKEAIKLARESFLLDSSNSKTQQLLSMLLKDSELPKDASFYESMDWQRVYSKLVRRVDRLQKNSSTGPPSSDKKEEELDPADTDSRNLKLFLKK